MTLLPPTHPHPCHRCTGPTPCPIRSRDRQQWCDVLLYSGLHVCLACKIKEWMEEGARWQPRRAIGSGEGGIVK